MIAPESLLSASVLGVALGVAFNPLASLVGAPVAAGLFGWPKASGDRHAWAIAVALAAWLVGDGFRVMARLQDVLASAEPLGWPTGVMLGAWALGGLVLGYVLPAGLGAYVGRRVVRGTGWLSAMFVAVLCSYALSRIAVPTAELLGRLAGG